MGWLAVGGSQERDGSETFCNVKSKRLACGLQRLVAELVAYTTDSKPQDIIDETMNS